MIRKNIFGSLINLGSNLIGLVVLFIVAYLMYHNSLGIASVHAEYALDLGLNNTREEILEKQASALEIASITPILYAMALIWIPIKIIMF
jgi:hypothetical protein